MEKLIYYSIAKFIPSVERDESINFGFSFYIPHEKKIGYIPAKNTKRILTFDDEITLDEINFLQDNLKYDFSEESFTYIDDDTLKNYFSTDKPIILHDKIYNYANIIQFDTIKPIVIEKDINQTLKDIAEFFLYYDKPLQERRINKAKLISMAKNTISAYLEKGCYRRVKHDTLSIFQKPFDFETILNNQMHYFKIIKFDYIYPTELYKELKALISDIQHFNNSEKIKLDTNNFHLVINPTEFTPTHEKIAHEEMKDYAHIFSITELPSFLSKSEGLV